MSRLALIALAAALVPSVLCEPAAAAVTAADELELPIVRELNRVRAAHGLPRLRTAAPLRRAADVHAASMAARGYFAHTSADGTTFDRRIARFYPSAGRSYWAVGENLLWASPVVSPRKAVALWMASPGHRRNILSPRYRQIGISAVSASAAPGVFGGREVTIVVTDFGARR